jgi:hypothetical protein
MPHGENLRIREKIREEWNAGILEGWMENKALLAFDLIIPTFHSSIIPSFHHSSFPTFHHSSFPLFLLFISLIFRAASDTQAAPSIPEMEASP